MTIAVIKLSVAIALAILLLLAWASDFNAWYSPIAAASLILMERMAGSKL